MAETFASLDDYIRYATSASGRTVAETVYSTALLPDMRRQIGAAESARQAEDHLSVRRVFEFWTEDNGYIRLDRALSLMHARWGEMRAERDLVDVGYVGIGRLEHVDANTQLKKVEPTEQPYVFRRIVDVRELYENFGLHLLPPFTIDGKSVDWQAEIDQDSANTAIILGRTDDAEVIIQNAISRSQQRVRELEYSVRDFLDVPDDELQSNYGLLLSKKRYLGALSAQGVLLARRGRKNHNLPELISGLKTVREAAQHEPDPHRLATLAGWTVAESRSSRHGIADRISGLWHGLRGLRTAYKQDSQSTRNAIEQYLRSGKNRNYSFW